MKSITFIDLFTGIGGFDNMNENFKEAKSLNSGLNKARTEKKDEFYTQLVDIEKELKHYKNLFRGKVVYCNCDDPYESNFFKYFALNFNALGLKKLIATSYSGSSIIGGRLPLSKIAGSKGKQPIKIVIKKVLDTNKKGATDLSDIEYILKHYKNTVTPLRGNGDFRSNECIKLLKEADIVVTNPPFSLFREYVTQLMEYKKKFIIIGNTNAITYKEIFKLFKQNQLRTGYTNFNVGMYFVVPDNCKKFHKYDENGNKIVRVSTSCWFTNLKVQKHKQDITLYKKYNPKDYPKYDNYDAINVNKYTNIPYDYEGVMGVPITFIDKHNPDQFEIVKFRKGNDDRDLSIRGKCPYFRILIRNKNKKVKKTYEDRMV